MRASFITVIALLCCLGLMIPASAAVLNTPTECDALVAHPDDPERVATGVKRDDRNPEKAIPACEAAVKEHPGTARLEFELGLALDKGDRQSEAVEWYKRAATRGYVAAIYALGWAYLEGEGTPKDETQGFRFIKQAAEKGHSGAKNTIGILYLQGRGVDKNESEAVRWFRLSADEGRMTAQHNLAAAYRDGRGIEKNEGAALRLFQLAAAQGYAPSMAAAGWMIERGRGSRADLKEAIAWYEKAAGGGYEAGLKALDRLAAADPDAAKAAQRAHIARGDASAAEPAHASSANDGRQQALASAASPSALVAHVPPAAYAFTPNTQTDVFDLTKRDPEGFVFFVAAGATSGGIRGTLEGDAFTEFPRRLVVCGTDDLRRGEATTDVVLTLAAAGRDVDLRTIDASGQVRAKVMVANIKNGCDLAVLKGRDWTTLYPSGQAEGAIGASDPKRAVRFVSSADVAAVLAERRQRTEEDVRRKEELRQSLARGEPSGYAYLALVKPVSSKVLCHSGSEDLVRALFDKHRETLATELTQVPAGYRSVSGLDAWFGAMVSGQCSVAAGEPRELAKLAAALARDGVASRFMPILADAAAIDQAKQELAARAAADAERRNQAEAARKVEAEAERQTDAKIRSGDIDSIMPAYIKGFWAESREKCGEEIAQKYDVDGITVFLRNTNGREAGIEPTIKKAKWTFSTQGPYIFMVRDEYVEVWRPIDANTVDNMTIFLPDGTELDLFHTNDERLPIRSLKIGKAKSKMVRCGPEAERLAHSIGVEARKWLEDIENAVQNNFQAQAVYHTGWLTEVDKKCGFLVHDYQWINGNVNKALFEATKKINWSYKDNLGKRLHGALLIRSQEIGKNENCNSPVVRERFNYHMAMLRSYQP